MDRKEYVGNKSEMLWRKESQDLVMDLICRVSESEVVKNDAEYVDFGDCEAGNVLDGNREV